MEHGIILKGIGGFYYVKTSSGVVECKARGKFRNESIKPLAGDYVNIEMTGTAAGVIEEICARRNSFVRPPVANVDTLVVVMALKNPEPDFLFIDKMSVIALKNNVDFALCFNKSDLKNDCDYVKDIYKNTGFSVITVSTYDDTGIDDLKSLFSDRITALAGLSGVGKSSILRKITNRELDVGAVSKKLGRGRHTTRQVELLEYKNGSYIADTPGFSMLDLPDIKAEDLENYFPEFSNCLQKCRYLGCSHTGERGCAVKEAAERGEISGSRYNSYKTFYEKLSSVKEW